MIDDVYKFQDRSTIEKEAAAWLIKLDGDQPLTAEEVKALHEWVNRSPVHREELGMFAEFWSNNILTELAVPLGKADDLTKRSIPEVLRAAFYRFGRGRVIATVLLLVMILAFTTWITRNPSISTDVLYATAVGQQQSITLSDGSVVQLNTNSQIKVEYSDQYRDIRLLQGEVFFILTKNPDRPFRVYAGNNRVQATGTAFSVYLKHDEVNIIVTEGSVRLTSIVEMNADALQGTDERHGTYSQASSGDQRDNHYVELLGTLNAGQSTTIKGGKGHNRNENSKLDFIQNYGQDELARLLSWRRGLLTFSGESLQEAIDEITRYTTLSIEIKDPGIRDIKIGGQFPVGETEAMFDALESNFGLRVTRIGNDRVQISAAGDPPLTP